MIRGAELKERLREEAFRLGFVALGVAPAVEPPGLRTLLEGRRREGRECSFEAKNLEERVSPQRLLPGARSVVVVAYPYLPVGHRQSRPIGPYGRLALYTWGPEDYHRVVGDRLENLAEALRQWAPGVRMRIGVDTLPLVEREFARLAGVGWLGKNGLMHVPGSGSYVFLGEILTDLPLPPDAPLENPCNGCDRCQKACPSGALTEAGLDARLCLSAVTQERGSIPLPLRALLGNRLFGCDSCQTSCPANRGARAAGEEGGGYVLLPALLQETGASFRRGLGRSAAGWRGLTLLRRNALVLLGNRREQEGAGPLAQVLEGQPSPLLRSHAAWALGRIGGKRNRALLERARGRETEGDVLQAIREALEAEAKPGGHPSRQAVFRPPLPPRCGPSASDPLAGSGPPRPALR